ncbi:NosD domain-containing protein [Opitutus sp. ER46]|uniref:NosD domain-containing protein n=1 Tax=Opitutus sp. ER46 TaxID=2161864 RepID=UPI000D30D93C|nr:NosD domain-containing protein [Opitutus sp. ER46]PTX96699.1 carbohydrate-binding protein [Opitutus sp. ER46]
MKRLALIALAGLALGGGRLAAAPGDELRARLAAAPAGATVHVAPGRYEGHFILARPVHLLGEPGAVLAGDRTGVVVAIRADDVELAGFTIRGSGRDLSADDAGVHVTGARAVIRDNRLVDILHGIYVRKANDARITGNTIVGDGATGDDAIADPTQHGLKAGDAANGELCGPPAGIDRRGNGIHLWNSSGHLIVGNTISGTRDGVYFSFASHTHVRANHIRQVRYGLHYMYSDDNTFEENEFSENAAGAALMFSRRLVLRANRFLSNRSQRAYGLLLQGIDDTRIEDNVISGNTLGLFAENGNGNTFRGNRITANYVGLRVSDSTATSSFFENTFAGNIHPVETTGENGANLWAVAGRGNHWDGAETLDLNHDGVADIPHFEPDLFGTSRRAFPAIGLLSTSPGERLLRWIQSRLALPGLPGIADPKPLTHPR